MARFRGNRRVTEDVEETVKEVQSRTSIISISPRSNNTSITTRKMKVTKSIMVIIPLLAAIYVIPTSAPKYFASAPQSHKARKVSVETGSISKSGPKSNPSTALVEKLEDENCEIVTPVFANRTPTALASYPGSGNTLTRVLIEALTGVWTGSTHGNDKMLGKQVRSVGNPADDRLTENVVVVKTHQPGKIGVLRWKNATRAIIIIRDPLNAIPSACNAKWEIHSQTLMHSEQTPVEKWIYWRDLHFDNQLAMWRKIITFWLDRIKDSQKRLVVIYEDLVDQEKGPFIAEEIMTFLGHGIIPSAKVPCIWRKVVKGSAKKIHRPRRYTPSYLNEQFDALIGNLTEIYESDLISDPNIYRAISLYIKNAGMAKTKNEKEGIQTSQENRGQMWRGPKKKGIKKLNHLL